MCLSCGNRACDLGSHRPWTALVHLLLPKPASDCGHSAASEVEAQVPGGERDIPRSKRTLPAPIPLYLPQSPKDTNSEAGITYPLPESH